VDVLFECSMIGIGRDSLFRSCGNSQPNRKMIAMLGELMTRNCAKAHCLVSYLLLDDLRSQHSFCANNGAICHLLMMMESVEIPTHS
jgi:hypothetical protein